MKYRVYYMKPESFRRFIIGEVPSKAALDQTHVFLREVEAGSLDEVFGRMQGEEWSPNGEARPLIEAKGLAHTSMSVGDVIETETGLFLAVAGIGFVELAP